MQKILRLFIFLFLFTISNQAQDYFFEKYHPFNKNIPTPEEFLGYKIGEYHTRHDLIVSYLQTITKISDRATIKIYGETNEHRKLLMLTITSPKNLNKLQQYKAEHLKVVNPNTNITTYNDLPVFINLGFNVHGNEPSGSESALLAAYTLIASENPIITNYLKKSIIFLDPTINPDGRDRFTNWVNRYRGEPLIADKYDIEHNESNPNSRTNHYLFDLNRDLLLAVQPESQARLNWFHQWYPNVVTDFHEMGTYSTYFFEPKQTSASYLPITPNENNTLNNAFAVDYVKAFDSIGSLYFTKERYDATYPGYGSTYGDLQGSLSLLFEQASSRGHIQETPTGNITFKYAIRNQYIGIFATIKAAIKNKNLLYSYQNNFFKNAKNNANKSNIKSYVFGDNFDKNRNKEFVDFLLRHKIKVYKLNKDLPTDKYNYKKGFSYVVPTNQKQYLMIRTVFETNNKFRDSVFYDASAWSVVNFYNMKYTPMHKKIEANNEITTKNNIFKIPELNKSNYAYLIKWDDYYTPAFLNKLHENNIIVKTSMKPTTLSINNKDIYFDRGSLLIPIQNQKINSTKLFQVISEISKKYNIQAYPTNSGFSKNGIDLGSSNFTTLTKPKAMILFEDGVSSYESGEVWHLLEKRVNMPVIKVPVRIFFKTDLDRYNTIIMVSGNYKLLSEKDKKRLKEWVSKGNTLITTRTASSWVIKNKIVSENLVKEIKDSTKIRLNYADSRGTIGKQQIGGAILKIDLDLTHPISFGYHDKQIPIYKNNRVFLEPAKSRFSTVAIYTAKPKIDGYITNENLEKYIKKSASIIVSNIGKGRVIMFADNPNFRGAWYGTNKLFLNALFFGSIIKTPL